MGAHESSAVGSCDCASTCCVQLIIDKITMRAENGFGAYEMKLPDDIPKLREYNFAKMLEPLMHELRKLGFEV